MTASDQKKIDEAFESEVINIDLNLAVHDKSAQNVNMVYYWNQPHCVFPVIVPLLECKE